MNTRKIAVQKIKRKKKRVVELGDILDDAVFDFQQFLQPNRAENRG
jgi:hypothetical protein